MARMPRFNLPGHPQHVVQRGNNKSPCFISEDDFRFYLECLVEASARYDCAVHAYCLMTNHVHLLVTPGQNDSLSRMMQHIGRRYVQCFNYAYERSGTLWEGRYKASLVQEGAYLLNCYRYIELNPVRARMVREPAKYAWSSYHHNALAKPNETITPHANYLSLGRTLSQRLLAYRQLLNQYLENQVIHDIREALNQEVVLGNDKFKDELETALSRRTRTVNIGRPKQNDKAG